MYIRIDGIRTHNKSGNGQNWWIKWNLYVFERREKKKKILNKNSIGSYNFENWIQFLDLLPNSFSRIENDYLPFSVFHFSFKCRQPSTSNLTLTPRSQATTPPLRFWYHPCSPTPISQRFFFPFFFVGFWVLTTQPWLKCKILFRLGEKKGCHGEEREWERRKFKSLFVYTHFGHFDHSYFLK